MNEKNTQYGVTHNPVSKEKETVKPRVPMAERLQRRGYKIVNIDGVEYELVDKKTVEDMVDKIERLERDLKRTNTRFNQLTNTLRSTIKDQASLEKSLKRITKI